MLRNGKKAILFILIIIFLSVVTMPVLMAITAPIADNEIDAEEDNTIGTGAFVGRSPITSHAAIVMDFTTGLVIYEFNANELRVPASMAKTVAAYVVFDAIRDGVVTFDTLIKTSEEVSEFSFNRGFSNVPMPPESSYTVSELLDVVIVRSASAATIALGEGIFGSEAELVRQMNKKAAHLGTTAIFYDSWGGSPDNRISARGMAEITRAFIKEYPKVLYFTKQESVYFDGVNYRSTNLLLNDPQGVDGFKTGFTNPAGWCFTATSKLEERRIISVTMGSEQGYRFSDSIKLLDYGFENYNISVKEHFRETLHTLENFQDLGNPLVPIAVITHYEATALGIHDLAIILNYTERRN